MFTIMENRKRPRLELINTNNNNSNETLQGVASTTATTTAMGTATLATIGGQSFILSNTSSSSLPANILLSICDDNSDESEEYILDHGMLTPQIKQEHTVATQTINQQNHQPTLLHTTVPQYRIVNQAAKQLNSAALNTSSLVTSASTANSSLLTNSVHLPPGCEIYVIKEVIDSPKQLIAAESSSTTSPKSSLNSNTTIKLEPMSPLPLLRHSSINGNNSQTLNNNSTITLNTTSPITTTTSSNNSSPTSPDESVKRSLILEAYKKRDDKRRATHNEVERRRRDKINSWIFKLKEMLPTEITPSNVGNCGINKDNLTTVNNQNSTSTTRLLVQQQHQGSNTTRTPPSDSKSQILIKACEYIKSMQEEIKSLRECLTENENLRLSNQRLQDEINNLRNKQQQQHKLHNNNNILLTTTNTTNLTNNNNHHHHNSDDNSDECEITLNSLNATYANVQLFSPTRNQNISNNNNHHDHLAGLVGLTTNSNVTTATPNSSVNVTYAKRELIITDYVD